MTLTLLKCGNCGATLTQETGRLRLECIYCGCLSIIENRSTEDLSLIDPQSLIDQSPEVIAIVNTEKKQRLTREIKFLEDQFLTTQHPSIPEKISNLHNQLSLLQGDGK